MWTIGFTINALYPLLNESIGLHGSLFIFASFSAASALFVLFYVPETKGLSYKSIENLLTR